MVLSFENTDQERTKVELLLRKEFQNTILQFRKDGIIHIICKSSCTVSRADIYKMAKFIYRIGGVNKYNFLIEPMRDSAIDNKARALLASKQGSFFMLKYAISCSSIVHEMIGNFFVRIDNPAVPTKIFKDKTKAIEWLLSSSSSSDKIVN
jgi:hypothetical protein